MPRGLHQHRRVQPLRGHPRAHKHAESQANRCTVGRAHLTAFIHPHTHTNGHAHSRSIIGHCVAHLCAIERADEYCADTEPIGGADSVANGNADIRSYTCAKPHANGASLR